MASLVILFGALLRYVNGYLNILLFNGVGDRNSAPHSCVIPNGFHCKVLSQSNNPSVKLRSQRTVRRKKREGFCILLLRNPVYEMTSQFNSIKPLFLPKIFNPLQSSTSHPFWNISHPSPPFSLHLCSEREYERISSRYALDSLSNCILTK